MLSVCSVGPTTGHSTGRSHRAPGRRPRAGGGRGPSCWPDARWSGLTCAHGAEVPGPRGQAAPADPPWRSSPTGPGSWVLVGGRPGKTCHTHALPRASGRVLALPPPGCGLGPALHLKPQGPANETCLPRVGHGGEGTGAGRVPAASSHTPILRGTNSPRPPNDPTRKGL